ncbi:MAG: DUF4143 domain-containing protein [Gammaproteobacteria bacterium]|nr:DUF4143 domain-containing protein [Gammaproteobacteria bacterium]
MNQLVPRRLQELLRSGFENSSCVLLLGPRQVGKTTLAREFGKVYVPDCEPIDLEQENARQIIENFDDFATRQRGKITILDEAQCAPNMFPRLRNVLDAQAQQGPGEDRSLWLILGSATQDLEGLANQNLSGRFRQLWLAPFDFSEINSQQSLLISEAAINMDNEVMEVSDIGEHVKSHDLVRRLWLRGGFPLSYLADDDTASLEWRRDYLKSILGPQAPVRKANVRADLLGPLWEQLAIRQGEPCGVDQLSGGLGCNKNELEALLYFLEHQNLIRAVRRWSWNPRKRLERQPIWFIRDSGLLHGQLRLERINDLLGSEIKGKSWEGFVLESLLASVPPETEIFYYRNDKQQEADFVLKLSANQYWVIEVKYSATKNVSPGFYRACDELNPERRFVVHAGIESLKKGDAGRLDWFCLPDALGQLVYLNN